MRKPPSGILLIDKPKDITSHDVVDRVRRVFAIRKVGHAGTLDPLATGVLVILVGEATKKSAGYTKKEKEYLIGVEFGKKTDTGDADGKVLFMLPPEDRKLLLLTQARVEDALEGLRGKVKQRVPAFSAVKVGGKKLYEEARKGKKVERPVREVEVKKLELEEFKPGSETNYPYCVLHAVVSAGTYTRSLVEDLGRILDLPAYQIFLRRLRSGQFRVEEAIRLPEFEKSENPQKFLRDG